MLPCEVAAQMPAADSGAVVLVAHRFHEALTRGDSSAAMALLSPDVVIMEGGGVERYADYR
jgi:ketosteroid isomerase-like protein